MITGLSGDNFFFDLRETRLKVVFHKSFGLFLIFFTFCHDHLQNILLVINQGVLSELCSYSLAGLNVRTYNVITI